MSNPTHAGQAVRNNLTGNIGITTEGPRKRTQTIGVQFLTGNYPVIVSVDDLVVIELAEVAA